MSTSLFIPSFLAQAAADSAAPGILSSGMLIPLLGIIMMFVMMNSSQRKRQKEQDAMLKALKVGDEVVTIGGVHAVVTSIKEKTVMLRIADGVKVEFDRTAIASVVKEPAAP